jgi:hypothetical protein
MNQIFEMSFLSFLLLHLDRNEIHPSHSNSMRFTEILKILKEILGFHSCRILVCWNTGRFEIKVYLGGVVPEIKYIFSNPKILNLANHKR